MKKISILFAVLMISLLSITVAYAAEDEKPAITEAVTEAAETEITDAFEATEEALAETPLPAERISADGNYKIKVTETEKFSYVDIIKYVGEDKLPKTLTIDEIDGYKVRNIRSKAFKSLKTLKNVRFTGTKFDKSTISAVKAKAFYNCVNLKSVAVSSLVKFNNDAVSCSKTKSNAKLKSFKFDDNAAKKHDVSNKILYADTKGVDAIYNTDSSKKEAKAASLKDVNGMIFKARLDGKRVKGWTSSDPEVVKVTTYGKATILKKGTAVLSIKSGKKTVEREFTVEENPYLSKNGEEIETVEVKNGKTVKVDVNGKATDVDNVYVNTTKAMVVSDANSDSLKIKGTMAGDTTLKITVNGKDLKLKVKVKKNPISDSEMLKIASAIGWQTNYAYSDSTVMCSAYSFAYAYKQVTGVTRSAGSFWSPGGCTWIGGTYTHYGSSASMLKAIKSSLDKNRACVGLLAYGSSATHYVTFYDYTGNGDKLSDFKIIDPWDGCLTTGAIFRYCSDGYHVVTVD